LIQFPKWPEAWYNHTLPAPRLGYQLRYEGKWLVLHIDFVGVSRLKMSANENNIGGAHWGLPSVRKC